MFAEIVPLRNSRISHPFTYKIPSSFEDKIKKGQIAQIPFAKNVLKGIITEIHDKKPLFETREILSIDFLTPVLKLWQIELANFITNYYHCPPIQAYKLFILPNRKISSKQTENKWLNYVSKKEHTLTPAQKKVLAQIQNSKNPFFLLHGVTGSGKTEIYLQLAREYQKKGKQSLILVPEITLTPQLIGYFSSSFQGKIAVIHSKLTPKQKQIELLNVKNRKADIVIGSRSAIFAPFKNLGLIVMDEEHEWTYKQESSPRYHTKNVAEKLATLFKAKLILASATPLVESYFAAKQGKYALLELPERIGIMPKCHIIDLKTEIKKRNYSIFSELLANKLIETVQIGKQALIFLNRRGFYSALVCRDCGNSIKCPFCDIAMVFHKPSLQSENCFLLCHYCNYVREVPFFCPVCHSPKIKTLGVGTEQVEHEVKKLIPHCEVLRADRDTTRKKEGFLDIYNAFKAKKAQVLIGTQMISKGLDLPHVHLVGVILADIGLHIPNFRSSERIFQLINQVAGRAGRRQDQGEVIIQTYCPENWAINKACQHDYPGFYQIEIENRQKLNYPPFSQIIKLTFQHKNKDKCQEPLEELKTKLTKIFTENDLKINIAPEIPFKKANIFRYNMFIIGKDLNRVIKHIPHIEKWIIDVDP